MEVTESSKIELAHVQTCQELRAEAFLQYAQDLRLSKVPIMQGHENSRRRASFVWESAAETWVGNCFWATAHLIG